MTPLMDHLFFNFKYLHPSLKNKNGVLTFDSISYVKSIRALMQKDTDKKDEEVQALKSKYSLKDKGMFDKYKDAKKGTVYVIQWIEVICDFAEKVRNLTQWEDRHMTLLFLLLLIVLFLVVTFLPLRFILTLSLAYKFHKGKGWQKKRVNNNQEVCKLELTHFLKENKFDRIFINWEHTWSSQLNTLKRISNRDFEQKLTEYFQTVVKIYLPKDILNIADTPNKLIEYVGHTPLIIRLPKNDRNEI